MIKLTATNGDPWTIYGVQAIPSDSIYSILQEAIDSGNPQQTALQQKTGHRAPIVIDHKNHVIEFHSW